MSNATGIRQPQIQRVHLASSVRGSRRRCPRVRYVADFRTSLHAHPLENREEWCYQRGIQGRRGWLDDSRSPQLSAGTHGKTKPSATKKANPGRLTLWYWWWMGFPRQTLAPEQASLRSRERFWDIRVPKIDSIFDNSLVPRPSWSPGVPPQHRKLVAATHRSPI